MGFIYIKYGTFQTKVFESNLKKNTMMYEEYSGIDFPNFYCDISNLGGGARFGK